MYFVYIITCAVCNTIFHAFTKALPKMDHPFASLTISFFTGSVVCLLLLLLTEGWKNVPAVFAELNWISAIIGVLLFGIETTLYYLYHGGSPISSTALIISVVQTIFNLFIAILLFHEHMKPINLIGIALCLIGSFLAVRQAPGGCEKGR